MSNLSSDSSLLFDSIREPLYYLSQVGLFNSHKESIMTDQDNFPTSATPDDQNQDHSDKQLMYPGDKKLFRIVSLTDSIAWAFLIVSVIQVIARLAYYLTIQNPGLQLGKIALYDIFTIVAGQLETLIFGMFVFLVLQALGEIAYLLLDIRYLLHPQAEEDNN
jgi:hypothetical protein